MEKNIDLFLEKLASSAPTPGGGGAAAVSGALGIALGSMVCSLTVGKKKYAEFQEEISLTLSKARALQDEILAFVDADAEAFEPLAAAYGLPRDTDAQIAVRNEIMENALKKAALVPLALMEKCIEAIRLHERLAVIGSRIAVSDVGVGVLHCRTALMSAALNVFINTKLMKDRLFANDLNEKATAFLDIGISVADAVYEQVLKELR